MMRRAGFVAVLVLVPVLSIGCTDQNKTKGPKEGQQASGKDQQGASKTEGKTKVVTVAITKGLT